MVYHIIYNSIFAPSIASALEAIDYLDGHTITTHDLYGTVTGDITTYCGTTLQDGTYDAIYNFTLSETASATSELDTKQSFLLRAKLKTAKQGTTLITVTDATTHTASTIGDSGETWVVNAYVGKMVIINGNTGADQLAVIKSNTDTVLTIEGSFETTPDATSDFIIVDTDMMLRFFGNTIAVGASTDGKIGALRLWSEFYPSNNPPKILQYIGQYTFPENGGKATSGTGTSITDTNHNEYPYSAAFVVDAFINPSRYVAITAGPGYGEVRKITDNAANSITIDRAWDTNPTSSSYYQVIQFEGDALKNAYALLFIVARFSDIENAIVLSNWRKLTNWGKVSDLHNEMSTAILSPYQDLEYLDFLLNEGEAIYYYIYYTA